MEFKYIIMEKDIKGTGQEVLEKVQEDCSIIIKWQLKAAGVMINLLREQLKLNTTRVNGKTIISMEEVVIPFRMVASMMGNG